MNKNSFSFMKEGFDWQQAQFKDMEEIKDRHDSDEEELKRESEELRDYSDFFADAGGFLGDR